ncbi:MAG: hypothetical protein QM650_12670 [Microlunatus sp.]
MAWHRWREPLAVLLLVALALMLAIRMIALGQALQADVMIGALGGIPGGDELLVVAAAGAVLWCATPVSLLEGESAAPSAHARPIAVVGLLVVGLTVLGWVALSAWAVVQVVQWPTPSSGAVLYVVDGIVRLVLPVVAFAMVVLAVGRTGAARSRRPASVRELPVATPTLPEASAEDQSSVSAEPEPERLPAAWHVDDAAGAVWLTADDAAQGRPGLSWSATAPEIPPAAGPDDPGALGNAPEPGPPMRPAAEDDDLR